MKQKVEFLERELKRCNSISTANILSNPSVIQQPGRLV